MKCKAFTLIELTIASAIILILSSLLLPSAIAIWRLTQLRTAQNRLRHILKVARMESLSLQHSAYGVLFFVDRANQQSMAFIQWSGVPDPLSQASWPDLANRFDVDTTAGLPEKMPRPWRTMPVSGLTRSATELSNEFHQLGWHRNFFAIIFRQGERSPYSPLIVRDRDDNADGYGDKTDLPVNDVDRGRGVLLKTIVTNTQQQPIPFATEWGIWLYDDITFLESPPRSRSQYVRDQGVPLFMSNDAAFVRK